MYTGWMQPFSLDRTLTPQDIPMLCLMKRKPMWSRPACRPDLHQFDLSRLD